MSQGHDYSPLALDDLVHLMSPSPAPQTLIDDPDSPPRTRSTSPEPLPESDIVEMRTRVIEMHHANAQLTQRERDLAEMVLRLTGATRPDTHQFLRQGEMISALIQQRDLLLHQFDEQRLRWDSEKDGWARMAEALLVQQAKNRPSSERDEDFERLQAAETDSKSLRQRLNETQSRLLTLESELTRLRPLLLMQPLVSRSSLPLSAPVPKTQHTRRRKKDAAATEDEGHGPSEDEPPPDPLDTQSITPYSQATPRTKSRKSEAPNVAHPPSNPPKRRPSHKASSRGLSADARVEHLLLAARKIGKQRAGIISGMVQHLEERDRERRREESAATAVANTPKTPKRNSSHTAYPSDVGYVYLNSQMRPGPGMQPVPMFIPAYPHHLLQTPSSSTTAASAASSAQQSAQKQKQGTRSNNPPTPLDSLLSAARSMMHEDIDEDEDEEIVIGDSPAPTVGTRHTRPKDSLGSPIPKRRKVVVRTDELHELTGRITDNVSALSANASGATNAGAGRVRSALDVLADQAAAFSTQEQPVLQTRAQSQTKGKEKERTDLQSQEPSGSTPKPRRKTESGKKEPEADTPSSVAPKSRSRSPQSDVGDNPAGSAHNVQPPAGGSVSDAPVDPSGESNNATTPQTLGSATVAEGNQVTESNSPGLSDASPQVDESADATPRQGSRIQGTLGKEGSDGTLATITQPNLAQLAALSIPNERLEAFSPHPESVASSVEDSGASVSASAALAKNKELARVAEQEVPAAAPPAKRQRSPYVKWSKEEDDLLAQAVAKYGQKWDLVQKALPSRGYHQVRQRWLRKLGVFDRKPDLSSFQTAATTFPSTSRGDGIEPQGNPKLGLAPLSSEKAFSGMIGRSPSLPS